MLTVNEKKEAKILGHEYKVKLLQKRIQLNMELITSLKKENFKENILAIFYKYSAFYSLEIPKILNLDEEDFKNYVYIFLIELSEEHLEDDSRESLGNSYKIFGKQLSKKLNEQSLGQAFAFVRVKIHAPMHNKDITKAAYNILELANSYNIMLPMRFNELLTQNSEMSHKLKVYCLSKIINELLTFRGSKKGVKFDKRQNEYVVHIMYRGEEHYVGRFKSLEEATEAERKAEEKYL